MMKKLVTLFLAAVLILTVCACGTKNYTAVPELKLSWEMSPEEAQNANSFKTYYTTREDGYSFLSSEPGQKLPRIEGLPLRYYTCIFKNGEMIQIKLSMENSEIQKGSIVMHDYTEVFDLFAKKYGPPAINNKRSGSLAFDGPSAAWMLDNGSSVEINGISMLGWISEIVYYRQDYGKSQDN